MSELQALEFRELSYSYRSQWTFKRKASLCDISFTVSAGEAFGYVGHNGAGKTTTIKCLLSLLRPTKGKIAIFGTDSRELVARRSVGYLPEQPYFYDYVSVRELLEFYGVLAGVPSQEVKCAVRHSLELVHFDASLDRSLRTLSKGQLQRVAMAQALLNRPRLLILDEPFSGLDPLGRKQFSDLLLGLKREGTTIFMSSHILKDVEFICDRVAIVRQGVMQGVFDLHQREGCLTGTYEMIVRGCDQKAEKLMQLADHHQQDECFLRLIFADRDIATEALRSAISEDLRIESFQFVHEGLEELFLRLAQTPVANENGKGGACGE